MKKIGLILLVILILSGCTSEKKILLIDTDANNQNDTNIGLIDLNDGETTYSGFGGKFLKVNSSQDGWEWADANGGSGTDTNCAVSGSCPNVLYKNTDISVLDINASDINAGTIGTSPTFALAFVSALNGILPTTAGINFGFPGFNFGNLYTQGSLIMQGASTAGVVVLNNTFAFLVTGTTDTGLFFSQSRQAYEYLSAGGLALGVGGAGGQIGVLKYKPRSSDPTFPATDTNTLGSNCYMRTFPDGNFWLCQHNPATAYSGLKTSGHDINFFLGTGGDINGNLDVDGNIAITPGKSITGFVYTFTAANTFSCDNMCNANDGNSFGNLTCIDSVVATTGVHNLCTSVTGQRTCICQN